MKVYQCIHKYPPHIPMFEKKYGVTDDMDFETLRRLVVKDGYASTYILQPALENKPDEVFYTLWDYERLQLLWARENNLKTDDLDEIKLAQLEEFKPDVFYNMSAMCDNDFIKKIGNGKNRYKCVYWNGFIEKTPRTFAGYHGQLTLHKPYVEYWKKNGLAACELQPGIPKGWSDLTSDDKSIDVLFYGQYSKAFFGDRNKLIEELLDHKVETGRDIRCHLQYSERRLTIFRIKNHPWTRIQLPIVTFPSKLVRAQSLPPLYGDALYRSVGRAKIVVNAYTDDNRDFKSNMRLFEACGLGALLISEEGNYPDGFAPDVDFYTYKDADGLLSKIEQVLDEWPLHAGVARNTQKKIIDLYSKERQWHDFQDFVASL